MDELNKLRVVDLKAELKKLSLPTAGRKAELVKRLYEAQQFQGGEGDGAKDGQGKTNGDEKVEEEHDDPMQNEKEETEEEEKKDREVKGNDVDMMKESETVENAVEEDGKNDVDTETDGVELAGAARERNRIEGRQGNSVEKGERKEGHELVERDSSSSDKKGSTTGALKRGRGRMSSGGSLAMDNASNSGIKVDETEREKKRSPEPSSEAPAKRPRTTTEPSPILHIVGFVRPFTKRELRLFLSGDDSRTIEDLWMNDIKSHCYVRFGNEAEGTEAYEAMYDLQWPPVHGKKLHVTYATQEHMDRMRGRQQEQKEKEESKQQAPTLTLDQLFKKTECKPHLYWKPLSDEEAKANSEANDREYQSQCERRRGGRRY